MATRDEDRSGDWSDIVDDLDAPKKPRPDPAPLGGRASDPVELVERPNAVENEGVYAYRPEAPPFSRNDPGPATTPDARGSAPSARPPSGRSGAGGLTLPAPDEVVTGRRARGAPLPDAVPRALFQEAPTTPTPKRKAPGSADGGRNAAIAIVVGTLLVAGLGVWFAFFRAPPPPPTGMVSIVSDPPGAEVLVDGRPIGQSTPAQMFDVPVGETLRIQLRKPGYGVKPEQQAIEVTDEGSATAYFALFPVGRLRVDSRPPGAEVRVDGGRIAGRTPLTIDGLEVGRRVRLQLALEDHLPVELEHEVASDADEVPVVELIGAARIAVFSEPSGATVRRGDEVLGETPLYDALVPEGERVVLRIEKPGYRGVTRRVRVRGDEQQLRVELKEQPLAALAVSSRDKVEARRLDRALRRAGQALATARAALGVAEARYNRVFNDPKAKGQSRARAEQALQRANERLAQAEDARYQLEAEAERFRARVLATRDR